MASMRDIKRRRESVQSTGQITKAMKLVSSVKLQKAKTGAEESKPYFDTMYETVASMIAKSGNMSHPFLSRNDSGKKAVIAVSSNRGLAGGYNSNVVKLVTKNDAFSPEDTVIYAVGTKARDSLAREGYQFGGDEWPDVWRCHHDREGCAQQVYPRRDRRDLSGVYDL